MWNLVLMKRKKKRFMFWTSGQTVHIERILFSLSSSTSVPKTSCWYKLGSLSVELGKTDGI